MQNRESPDFRSLEVGRYVTAPSFFIVIAMFNKKTLITGF